jgi:hypothetical protein
MTEGRHNAVIYNRVSTQHQIDRTVLNSMISLEEHCLLYITLLRCKGGPTSELMNILPSRPLT